VQPVNRIVNDTVRKNISFFVKENTSLENSQKISDLSSYESSNVLGIILLTKLEKLLLIL